MIDTFEKTKDMDSEASKASAFPGRASNDIMPQEGSYTGNMVSDQTEFYERRNELLKDIDQAVIKKAWFSFSHILAQEDAKVVDMGCGEGEMVFAMAVLNPGIHFIGVDKSKRAINKAKELYQNQVHNLEFIHSDVGIDVVPKESVDAIINSYILHQVYSGSKYNPKIVSETLTRHFRMLKTGGMMFIRDYARPPPEEFVLMEMPDEPSEGDTPSTMTETDLLMWYSENARPRHSAGCGGFFLEEMPPRVPRTRLFRLPYKWAYEFVMRKDERDMWDKELPIEYTFYTMREFRNELRSHGARVQYSGPFWDEDIIEDKFEGHFRLYKDDATPLGHPPTCFIAVAVKLKDRKSLEVMERRPSKKEKSSIKVQAMRNENTGDLVDVVSRETSFSEVLPYAIDDNGKLKVYLHDGIVRPVTNSVQRRGVNIDGKRWSGHLIEPISVESTKVFEMGEPDQKSTILFARDYLGLKPEGDATLIHGPDYYPAPSYIDDRIYTYFLHVRRNAGSIAPKTTPHGTGDFQDKGVIREFDAQQILNSIAVGMIPNARLELQILTLIEHLGLKAESWTSKNIIFQASQINERIKIPNLLIQMSDPDKSFKEIKGTTGQIRVMNSIFVEEGQSKGAPTGLNSDGLDFVISDQKTRNTAVVIPLTKGLKDDLHAGFIMETLPVPQRHEGNGMTMSAPSFNIPPEVTNFQQLKRFVAEQMNVTPDNVIRLGESYYNHISVTPQRIFPFAVAAPPKAFAATNAKFVPMHQYRLLWSALGRDTHFMLTIARAWQFLNDDIKEDYQLKVRQIIKERFEGKRPDWSIPMSYVSPPGKVNKDKEPVIIAQLNNDKRKEPSPLSSKPEKPKKHLAFHERAIMIEKDQTITISPENAEKIEAKLEAMKNMDMSKAPQLSDDFSELESIAQAVEEALDHSYEDLRPEKW